MKSIIVLSETAVDLEIGRDFYDSQGIGVGDYFVDSLLTDIESLRLFHGIHPLHFGYHRMLADRFPFGIYYEDTEEAIQIVGVLDLRRDPFWIHSELSTR